MAAPHPLDGREGTIRVAVWADGKVFDLIGGKALAALGGPRDDTAVWVDLTDPSPAQVADVAKLLGLHPLIVEDIIEGNQRSKIETTDDRIHVVLFSLDYTDRVVASELDFVLGPDFLLSVHEEDWEPRDISHFRSGLESVLKHGPDHILWAFCDAVVDGYFPFADRVADAVDRLQDEVVQGANRHVVGRLFALKQDLITVRRAVAPVREILNQLTNREQPFVDEDEVVYFRDVYDHVIRLTDELDNDRELVAATLEVYLSTVNNDLSRIMKRLTGVTVIVAGVGAVAGIFGMSEAGPSLAGQELVGFWIITVGTLVIAALAAWFLRKIDWI
jgi:magnesium transporter